MDIKVGSILNIKGIEGQVVGWIMYKNTQDGDKTWTEYRIITDESEIWLSMDDYYGEYSISWPDNNIQGNVGPEWHEVDRGHQVVVGCSGNVDVERGDEADFAEFEDASEDRILSVEIWDDGTEYSRGEYIELSDIQITGFQKPHLSIKAWTYIIGFILIVLFSAIDSLPPMPKRIDNYLKSSKNYEYVTSITGNARQKADVYKYKSYNYSSFDADTTDMVTKDIIDGIDGRTESVTQQDEKEDAPVAIVTDKEYCLIYHPEGDNGTVYVQISKRKYNYTSDNSPYKSSDNTTHWYRSHYYSSGYSADSSRYNSSPSAYSMYNGDTIHNIGNGYYDSYSSSVRQSSINARRSSGGGGK